MSIQNNKLMNLADGKVLYDDLRNRIEAKYTKPETGIPSTDIASGVIPDVSGKADKANPVFTGSISLGRKANTTAGTNSTAVGYNVTASGVYAHAEGNQTTASAQYTHAEGSFSTASSAYAHAEGSWSTASADCAHAEGKTTTASGEGSHSEGNTTTASGDYSHAEGEDTEASGKGSHAEGSNTIARCAYQSVFGIYNVADPSVSHGPYTGNYVEIVGNGSANARSNARTLDWNGNEELAGDLTVNKGTANEVSVSELKSAISGKVDEPSSEGTSGQVLTTDGNGGRSWTTVQGGGSVTVDDELSTTSTNPVQNKIITGAINEIIVDEPDYEWIQLYESTDSSQTQGLNSLAGYIRSTSGSYPGRISSNASRKTCWFQAVEQMSIYLTCTASGAVGYRLRISTEVPVTGNSQPFTGDVYDESNMPTQENPLIVPAGKYVAFGFTGTTTLTYTIKLFSLEGTTKKVLNPVFGLTNTMKSEISSEIESDISDQTTVLRNSYERIELTWGIGNFTITDGADIRGALDGNTSRRSCQTICVPYPLAIGNDDGDCRVRLSKAGADYKIIATGSFNNGYSRVIPANTPVRLTFRNHADSDVTEMTDAEINAHVTVYALFPNGYAHVKWCAMGDSITEGWYSKFDNGTAVNGTDKTKVWATWVSIINGWEITNIGRGSTGWLDPVNEGDYTTAGFYVARNTDFTPYNLVTLAYGINDWKANRTAGSYTDVPVADETPTTVMQAMRATIEAIMASNPVCKIIVILPLNCVGYNYNYGDKSTNYGLGYRFSNSGTLEEYVQKMIEVCNYYGIQYIDQTHYSCINRENLLTMLPDGVHPSTEAHILLANELSKKITF